MRCSDCGRPMVALEAGGVEVDHCLACGSIWLDAGELQMLFDRPDAHDALLDSFSKAAHRVGAARKCPICGAKMDELTAGASLIIERCPKDGGYWFDRGELAATLKSAPGGTRSEVMALLSEIFPRQQQGGKA